MTTTTENTLTEVQQLVREFKTARDTLKSRMMKCKEEQQATVRRLAPGIKIAAEKTRDAEARLTASIERNPELFIKPKTITIEGIKVGYTKGKGKTIVPRNALDLIKKHFPEMVDLLINCKESVNKAAIANLPAGVIKKIGCSIIEAGEQIIVSTPKDDLDKLVDALLEDAEK